MSNTDKITIIWNAYQDENEWMRHNENQRAQLTNILLIISAALLAFRSDNLNQDHRLIPTLLVGIGSFGILAVMKYWERFMYHGQFASAWWKLLDSYFASNAEQIKDEDRLEVPKNLLCKIDEEAIKKHEQGRLPLLKDRYFMQYWLWEGVFVLITLLGISLFFDVW